MTERSTFSQFVERQQKDSISDRFVSSLLADKSSDARRIALELPVGPLRAQLLAAQVGHESGDANIRRKLCTILALEIAHHPALFKDHEDIVQQVVLVLMAEVRKSAISSSELEQEPAQLEGLDVAKIFDLAEVIANKHPLVTARLLELVARTKEMVQAVSSSETLDQLQQLTEEPA